MHKQTQGFATVFVIILIAIAVVLVIFWDDIRIELRETFGIGEERNSELQEAIEETNP